MKEQVQQFMLAYDAYYNRGPLDWLAGNHPDPLDGETDIDFLEAVLREMLAKEMPLNTEAAKEKVDNLCMFITDQYVVRFKTDNIERQHAGEMLMVNVSNLFRDWIRKPLPPLIAEYHADGLKVKKHLESLFLTSDVRDGTIQAMVTLYGKSITTLIEVHTLRSKEANKLITNFKQVAMDVEQRCRAHAFPPTRDAYETILDSFEQYLTTIWNEFAAAYEAAFGANPPMLRSFEDTVENAHFFLEARIWQIRAFIHDWRLLPAIREDAIRRLQSITCTDESCNVCYEPMNEPADDSDRACVHPPCGHKFHRSCIVRWFTDTVQCPVCRRSAI